MDGPAAGGRSRQRGFALIIVLWSLVLLTLIATQLTATGRAAAKLSSNLRSAAEAGADADGCVHATIAALLMQAGPGQQGLRWPPDPTPRVEQLRGARAVIRVGTEDGKLDLNSVAADRLAQLLRALDVDAAQAQQLALDVALWRFPSAQTNERRRAYVQAGKAYGPPGAPFQSVAELSLVLGMTPAILARLAPHVTVYHDGDPDPRAADPVVLSILGPQNGPRAAPPGQEGGIAVIDVEVRTDAGSLATRHAIVRVGAAGDQGGWRILEWK